MVPDLRDNQLKMFNEIIHHAVPTSAGWVGLSLALVVAVALANQKQNVSCYYQVRNTLLYSSCCRANETYLPIQCSCQNLHLLLKGQIYMHCAGLAKWTSLASLSFKLRDYRKSTNKYEIFNSILGDFDDILEWMAMHCLYYTFRGTFRSEMDTSIHLPCQLLYQL